MPDNTPGFEFNENPASPNSEASAVNLNNLVKKAVIRNIAPAVVASTHLHPSVAGAGIGGANGSPLFVKTDDETLEVADDKLKVKDGGIGAAQIADGSNSMDKLADAVKTAISTRSETISSHIMTKTPQNDSEALGNYAKTSSCSAQAEITNSSPLEAKKNIPSPLKNCRNTDILSSAKPMKIQEF